MENSYTTKSDIEAMAEAMREILEPPHNKHDAEILIKAALAASPVHAELAQLRTRLEMDSVIDANGKTFSWQKGMPDGIDSRNSTIDSLAVQNEKLRAELTLVKDENEKLRACLSYYANPSLYKAPITNSELYYDCGTKAKQALQQKGNNND